MRRLFAGLSAVFVLAASTTAALASPWLMVGHDAQNTYFNSGEHTLSASNVRRLHTAWSSPGVLYAIASDHYVYAIARSGGADVVEVLDVATGHILRRASASSLGFAKNDGPITLAYARGRLIVGGVSSVIALHAGDLHRLWRTAGGAGWLAISGSAIYTGKGCQNVVNACGTLASYALDLMSGRVLWKHVGNFGSRPVLIAGGLYQTWGEYSGVTRVYAPRAGQLVASLPLYAQWTGDQDKAYALVLPGATKPSWLGRIGPSGKPLWKATLGVVQGCCSSPVYAYDTLFVQSNRFHPGVLAVNAASGKARWGADLGPSISLMAANHLLYCLHQSSGALDVLEGSNGTPVTHLSVRGYQRGGSAVNDIFVSGGTLYVLGGTGLIALRP